MALKRPDEISHARGLAGTPSPRPLLQRSTEGSVQRVLGEVEVAELADEGGEDTTRFGVADDVHHLAHLCACALASHAYPLERPIRSA